VIPVALTDVPSQRAGTRAARVPAVGSSSCETMKSDSLFRGILSFLFIGVGLSCLRFALLPMEKNSFGMLAGGLMTGALVLAYLAYRRALSRRAWRIFGFVRPTLFDLGVGVLAGIASWACGPACAFLGLCRSGLGSNRFPLSATGSGWIAAYGLGVVGLAFSEECIFRAYLIPAFEERFRSSYAVLLSSLIFSFFHFQDAVPTFASGLILGTIFIRRRSLWPSVMAHVLHNITITLLGYFLLERAVLK